jgi:serine/threonine protein kinase
VSEPPVQVVDRYAIYGQLASGAMGAVHLGRLLGPIGFVRTVVIKRLHAHYASDPVSAAMFLDEARLAARIRHPNVVSTIDVVATTGEILLVLEYVLGEALARLLRATMESKGRVPLPITMAVMSGVLHGLDAAHEATDDHGKPLAIVHRDVSPQNILVGVDGVARVLDFGVMKAEGSDRIPTQPGHLRGKIPYMPPEQLLGREVDRLSDVYSAGVVLWELVAARRLFPADFGDASGKILAGVSEPPSKHRRIGTKTLTTPEMNQLHAMDAIVMRAVATDPAKRYPTARAMALAIEAIGPLATQSTVGSWVQSLAKDSLAKRAAWVREIEERSAPARETGAKENRAKSPPSGLRKGKEPASREPVEAKTIPWRRGRTRPSTLETKGAPLAPRTGLLKVGDLAPEIDHVTTNGARYALSKSASRFTVLFFFPKAKSPLCTRQARLFRNSHAELALAGADVVGISTDEHETQCDFASQTQAKFPFIADEDGAISRAYGVMWPVLGRCKRATFVIDRSMRVVAAFRHELRIDKHRDGVLVFLDARLRARQARG